MRQVAPWMTRYVHAVDTERDKNKHDVHDEQLYTHLLHKAAKGEILAITGGTMCRTWSICFRKPQRNGQPGRPLRGRHYPEVWGMQDLDDDEWDKTEGDSLVLLRQLQL